MKMKSEKKIDILYYFPESESYMHKWQRVHFIDELSRHNINFEIFNPLHYKTTEIANENLLKKIKENGSKYDLFFTAIGDNYLRPSLIREIKKSGLPALLICFDNLHAPFMHRKTASYYDLVWLTSYETQPMFKRWGAKTTALPYAANPYFFRQSDKAELPFAGFIGKPYGTRAHKINFMTENQIPFALYTDIEKNNSRSSQRSAIIRSKLMKSFRNLSFGIGRKMIIADFKRIFSPGGRTGNITKNDYLHIFPSVSFEKMAELFSTLSLSVGITEITNTYLLSKPVYKLHLRTFEIPMSGGLQITNYTDELASYFENGKEILMYKTDEELISKSKFYLDDKNSVLRNKIKKAARKRTENDHTWLARFKKIFGILGV